MKISLNQTRKYIKKKKQIQDQFLSTVGVRARRVPNRIHSQAKIKTQTYNNKREAFAFRETATENVFSGIYAGLNGKLDHIYTDTEESEERR